MCVGSDRPGGGQKAAVQVQGAQRQVRQRAGLRCGVCAAQRSKHLTCAVGSHDMDSMDFSTADGTGWVRCVRAASHDARAAVAGATYVMEALQERGRGRDPRLLARQTLPPEKRERIAQNVRVGTRCL